MENLQNLVAEPVAAFINVFFIPAFTVLLYYKRNSFPVRFTAELLLQYLSVTPILFLLSRASLSLFQKLDDVFYYADNVRYTFVSLVLAWLLSILWDVARKVKMQISVSKKQPQNKK